MKKTIDRILPLAFFFAVACPISVMAQRAEENAVTSADDAFGRRVGSEQIGLYSPSNVRGFSAVAAQNVRIEGLYFDRQGAFTSAIEESSSIRVSISALGYPFPAPTGIVDYTLRRVGKEQVISTRAGFGNFVAPFVSVDAALKVTADMDLNIGVGFEEFATAEGSDFYVARYGGVARWRPVENVELSGFYGRYDYWDEEQAPSFFTAGSFLPPRIPRGKFFGQDWAEWEGHSQNYGFIAKSTVGPWEINAGLFNSRFTIDDFGAALFTDTQPNGLAEKRFLLGENQRDESFSGELQLLRRFVEGPRLHKVFASLRGRRVNNDFGGFASVSLGVSPIAETTNEPEPEVSPGSLTEDRIRQWTGAFGYELRWQNQFEVSLGVQRTSYEQTVTLPGELASSTSDEPWLWNASAAFTGFDRLVIYAAATRGLEESGTAPQNATNANQTLPALRTRQVEAGIRYTLPHNMRLVAGLFDVRRPYFELDSSDNVFRVLGEVSHQGAEISLAGSPTPGLDLVFGAVLLNPRVSGEAVDDGRLGKKPLGPIETVLDARLNYRIPWFDKLSLDAGIAYTGDRVARIDNSVEIPERVIIDVGARYRFEFAGAPALLRMQLGNLTDEFGWRVSRGGSFRYEPQRRLSMTLTVDY
ncbi:MAG: TonB-dependent receptor [Pseudomonadota bacterium]